MTIISTGTPLKVIVSWEGTNLFKRRISRDVFAIKEDHEGKFSVLVASDQGKLWWVGQDHFLAVQKEAPCGGSERLGAA